VVSIEIAADGAWSLRGSLRGIHGAPRYASPVPVSTLVWRTALCEQCICQKISLSRKEGGATVDPTVQVRQRGSHTLPASLREHDKIKPDDTFKIMDLDGIFVPMPLTPMVPELAGAIEQARVGTGLSG
jgi:hypothetical protein